MEPAEGPPINEVVLSISFAGQNQLAGPRLLVALRQLTAKYPEIEENLPYDMPEELPTKNQLTNPPPPNFQIVGPAGPAKRRYWLTNKDDKAILVQVQSDYFAVNWRAGHSGQKYPGFARLKEVFFETLALFNETVSGGSGANLQIHQVELSYVNVIKPTAKFDDHSYLRQYLNIAAPFIASPEQLNIAYTRPLETPNGTFYGRSYTSIQTAYQFRIDVASQASIDLSADLELDPVVNLNTSVRSARQKELSLDEVSILFDQEHAEATRSFMTATTQSAHDIWGLE